MGLSRLEVNLRRLLVKCEFMVKNNQKDDQRFPKYIISLTDMLTSLQEINDSDNIPEYNRRINILKSLIAEDSCSKTISSKEISDSESGDEIPIKNVSTRDELLGTENNLRLRNTRGSEDADEILEYHQNMQEKIAEDMLILTRNLKEQSELANKIIKQDTEVATKSAHLTDKNFSKLKVESEKLAEHSRRACKCWMWIMLIIVMIWFYL
ncbi:Unconventional SNARE in the ER 1 [Carabus blaptoides fortunei]